VLFEARFREAIAEGSVTLTFRRWKRCQVIAGHRYRTAAGMIEVEAIDVIEPSSITDAEARHAGFPSAAALVGNLREGNSPVYRVQFHGVAGPDPRDELASTADLSDDDRAELDRRLDRRLERLDRASPHGPWTAAVLQMIAEQPAVRAADLAASFGRETRPFKLDVRKLKNLGLTISLERGYRLSPRGEVYRRGAERNG